MHFNLKTEREPTPTSSALVPALCFSTLLYIIGRPSVGGFFCGIPGLRQPLNEGASNVLNESGNCAERTVWTMDKFTLPDDKCLVVELAEKNGGRNQQFVIENSDLVRAKLISELKVK